MADISITASGVVPTASTEYVDNNGIAGAVIAAGEMVYKDSNNVYQLADANVLASLSVAGMAMNSALAIGQPLTVAKGLITIGSGFTPGMQVNLSANAGKLAPVADVGGNYVVACGCIYSATQVIIAIKNYAVLHA